MAAGSEARGLLILTVTRACNLRCAYCPTAKDGWPSLTPEQARRAVQLFAQRYGGGEIKLFGGEPLLVPEVVRAALDEAHRHPSIRRIQLSTNGLGLDEKWLHQLRQWPKALLQISMDGTAEDHRRLRVAAPGVDAPDAYAHLLTLRPLLLRQPRVILTQVIAPATASRAAANFQHLLELGFTRFNLLPGYYLPWRPQQLTALEQGFAGIRALIEQRWAADQPLYLRNLFTLAPTPFFNTGLVLDADGSFHPSNVGLAGALDDLRQETRVGDLEHPPEPAALAAAAARVNGLLERTLKPSVWRSTLAVDASLTAFCRSLYPALERHRARRQQHREQAIVARYQARAQAAAAAAAAQEDEGCSSTQPVPVPSSGRRGHRRLAVLA